MIEKLHQDMVSFLMGEFVRPGHATCVRLDLLYAAGPGFSDEEMQSWLREENPEQFEVLGLVEKLVRLIIERCERHVDTLQRGKHRYVLRTKQALGGGSTFPFSLQPHALQMPDEDTGNSMIIQGGTPKAGQDALLQGFAIAMRHNGQMHESTVRTLFSTNKQALEENVRLREENHGLRRKLDDAESAKHEREWRMHKEQAASQRSEKMFGEVVSFGKLALTKALGGSSGKEDGSTRVMILLRDLKDSIQEKQVQALTQIFSGGQFQMFIEIMTIVENASPETPPAVPPPSAPNGQPHP